MRVAVRSRWCCQSFVSVASYSVFQLLAGLNLSCQAVGSCMLSAHTTEGGGRGRVCATIATKATQLIGVARGQGSIAPVHCVDTISPAERSIG